MQTIECEGTAKLVKKFLGSIEEQIERFEPRSSFLHIFGCFFGDCNVGYWIKTPDEEKTKLDITARLLYTTFREIAY